MSIMRVRQVLDGIGGNGRRGLLKYMPKYSLPDYIKGVFPTALLSSYSDPNIKYSEIGLLTEKLVLSHNSIDMDYFINSLSHISDPIIEQKIRKSKTTIDYLSKVEKTRNALNEYLITHGLSLNDAIFDAELTGTNIQGHPDAIIGTKIVIEVKTTSKLDVDHPYFIQQLSAYMALNPQFTHGLLVLPLQCAIIVITNWENKTKYLQLLETKAKKIIDSKKTVSMEDLFNTSQLIEFYGIGSHVPKLKTFLETVTKMTPGIPYQIFLGGNSNTKMSINNEDINLAGDWVRNNNINLYIHAPYVINLATKYEDPWQIEYMSRTMEYGAKLGAKGVVIHVGKSTNQELSIALDNMSNAVSQILEKTDPSCPLLIETPAGQGTEMLRDMVEFSEFIKKFIPEDPLVSSKIGACLDTCHVFAAGHKPSEYIQYIGDRGLLRLVHYNDSNDICGSCKDRHALVGQGHIGIAEMTAVADYCGANKISMVIE
jgi:deoxyribonuclease-4